MIGFVDFEEVTEQAKTIHELVKAKELDDAHALLPEERPYQLPDQVAAIISTSPEPTTP